MSKFVAFLIAMVFVMDQGTFPARGTQAEKIKLRVSISCCGVCGDVGNKVSFILYEDNSTESVVSDGQCLADEDRSILKRKVISLSQEEIDDLLNQLESQEFMKAEAVYQSDRLFPDTTITTTILYRKAEIEKRIRVRNFDCSSCPEPVKRIISKAEKLLNL